MYIYFIELFFAQLIGYAAIVWWIRSSNRSRPRQVSESTLSDAKSAPFAESNSLRFSESFLCSEKYFLQNAGNFLHFKKYFLQNEGTFLQVKKYFLQNVGTFPENAGTFLHFKKYFLQNEGTFLQNAGNFRGFKGSFFESKHGTAASPGRAPFLNSTYSITKNIQLWQLHSM